MGRGGPWGSREGLAHGGGGRGGENGRWAPGFLSQKSFSAMQEGRSSLAAPGRSSGNLLFQVHALKNVINLDVLGVCCVSIAKQNQST